jgi:hypothetical protein
VESKPIDAVTDQEVRAQAGRALPDREALSLISTSPTALPADSAALDELTADAPADYGGATAADGATSAADSVAADASASEGGESVTDTDRSETYSNSDSAAAQS